MTSILITGISGVGKTTITRKLAEEFNIPYISIGDIIYSIAKRELNISKREELYELEPRIRKEIQKEANLEIRRFVNKNELLLIDDKLVIFEKDIIFPHCSFIDDYKIKYIILIIDKPQNIIDRIKRDKRKRIIKDKVLLIQEQHLLESFVYRFAFSVDYIFRIPPVYSISKEILKFIIKNEGVL